MEKRYDHTQAEPAAQQQWKEEKTYAHTNNPGPVFSIDTPPPTVSGNLHIGHIFSYTQTDIIARFKRMEGHSVFYPFGFDDNGLPTEKYVEKKCKVRAHDMQRSEFIKLCLQETVGVEEQFKKLWERMGLSADWNKTYSTISDDVRALSQESFIDLYKKDYVYRDKEPALYCIACQTTVAQAELDDVEKPSFFNDIVFKDQKGNDLIIGTTRPELLSSCVALLYNPEDERYKHLKDQKAIVPIFENEVPILQDEAVSIEKGTGLVMCCTFGDKTDIEWYKKFKLPYKQSIQLNGKWADDTGILAGLKAKVARTTILDELKERGLLVGQKEISHAVNVHERCKKEIEYVVLPQWFIKILPYKEQFLAQADKIDWYPSFMKTRYKDWVTNLSWDWCISRQRFYGIPFPVWHCKDCKEVLLAQPSQLPVDPQETPYDKPCSNCKSTNIVPDTDVMDTWNTSALTPYICASLFVNDRKLPLANEKVREFIPMSMRPQAHDIIRTWAFYSITRAWMHQKTIPWKQVVVSGHVLSDGKEKLSKSKGNALAPEKLLERYPADVIRYWTASGSLGHDVAFSENQLKIGQRLVTKLWNEFRFVNEHIAAIEDPKKLPKELGAAQEWLLNNASTSFKKYKKYLNNHEFNLSLDSIEQFFWHDFCDNYLELVKHQLFNPDEYSKEAVYATQWTLYQVGLRILQMYAPYLPHVTEAIYQNLYKKTEGVASLHQTKFETVQVPYTFEKSAALMNLVIQLIGTIRKLKTEKELSLKVPLVSVTLYADNDYTLDQLKTQEQLLKGVTHASQVKYKVSDKLSTTLEEKDGAWHAKIGIESGL